MAMSSGTESGSPMSEINVTPLVDVMLVLLIIFMITAPLMSHRITVKLPNANPHVEDNQQRPPPLDVAIKEDGSIYYGDSTTAATEAELIQQFKIIGNSPPPQPEVQIRAAQNTQFGIVRKVLADAKASSVVHIDFVTTGKE
jgi:biopolymer transport protein ExbD